MGICKNPRKEFTRGGCRTQKYIIQCIELSKKINAGDIKPEELTEVKEESEPIEASERKEAEDLAKEFNKVQVGADETNESK